MRQRGRGSGQWVLVGASDPPLPHSLNLKVQQLAKEQRQCHKEVSSSL